MPQQTRHILGAFDGALSRLNDDIQRMGAMAQNNLDHAVRGLLERRLDLCNLTVADDEQVDELEKQIDHDGVEIIMKFGPVARDLRLVISVMKAATAIERISDHAVSFARRARETLAFPPVPEAEGLRGLADLARAMLKDAVSSFCERNLQAAVMIRSRDSSLDNEYRSFNQRLIHKMSQDAGNIPQYVDLLFCARFLERVGDQSVNISEDAVYLLTAIDIRHGGEMPKIENSD